VGKPASRSKLTLWDYARSDDPKTGTDCELLYLVHVSRQNLQDFYTNEMAECLEDQAHEMRRVHHELLGIFLSEEPDEAPI